MARTVWETIQVTGEQLADAVHKLVEAGNVRRIRIRQGTRTIAEFPLTLGVVGAVFAPMLAAVGALAAIITECTIDVEREVDDSAGSPESSVSGPGSGPESGEGPESSVQSPGSGVGPESKA